MIDNLALLREKFVTLLTKFAWLEFIASGLKVMQSFYPVYFPNCFPGSAQSSDQVSSRSISMAQLQFAAESLEVNLIADAADLIFLDDATCEFVGGGDAVNGY